jgi:hypothetical protein
MPPPSRPEDRAKASAAAAAASWAQVSQEVDAVEAQLHALRGQYEQYFLGLEKRPPTKAHEQFKKRMATLRTVPSRNSALSFRIQSLQATAATYERLWMKTMQEMEDGTYRRDVFKARMRRKSAPEVPAAPAPTAAQSGAAAGAKPAATGKVAAGAKPETPPAEPQIHIAGAAPPDPLGETRLRSVYRAYVEAKRRCNEDTTRLSFDAVAESLKRQVPELLERHKVRDVEYRVFVKDGKAILRAVPKI